MGVQVHKHIASLQRVPFRSYMDKLLKQHGCRCLFQLLPISLTHITFLRVCLSKIEFCTSARTHPAQVLCHFPDWAGVSLRPSAGLHVASESMLPR